MAADMPATTNSGEMPSSGPEHDSEKASSPQPSPTELSMNQENDLQGSITGFRWVVFVFSSLTAIFVYSLDNTIVANIIPVIVNDLDGVDKLPWLSVGFMIGGMATIMPFGKIYLIYDSKWVFIISCIFFLAGSALCGAAPTIDAEIVGRVIAGAGGNGMYFGLQTLMSIYTTDKERPKYLSYVGSTWGLGTVCGPAVGGGFSLWNWRWGFYINLLFGAILLPTYVLVIPSTIPMPDKTQLEKIILLDWPGIIISIGAMVTIVMAINLGGVEFPWSSGSIIALFVVSGVLWVAFALQQRYCIFTTVQKRLFPVHLLSQKMPVLLFIACAAGSSSAYMSTYYIPIYFQFAKGDSAIYTAVRLLPFICLVITVMLGSGHLISSWGWYKPWFVGGSILVLLMAALMAHFVNRLTAPGIFYVLELFLAIGVGAFSQNSFAVIQSVVEPKDGAHGLSLMLVAQLTGLAFGLSVTGAVFINTATNSIRAALPQIPANEVSQIVAGASGNVINSLSPEQRDLALDLIVMSWQKTFICISVAGAAGLVASIFFKNTKANTNTAVAGGL
ncbi:major facilitator superfamily domain-containing protein [Hypoxylon sp. FL1857]|nr:major facilitator superfamily domain-containing protein [Hypoxylon sp. FL1857]